MFMFLLLKELSGIKKLAMQIPFFPYMNEKARERVGKEWNEFVENRVNIYVFISTTRGEGKEL